MSFTLPIVLLLQAAPPLPAESTPVDPPQRRAGWYGELAVGTTMGSAPTTPSELSVLGFLTYERVAFTFPIGERWRLGPGFGAGFSMASATDSAGERASVVYAQASLGAQLEVVLSDVWSLGFTPGIGYALATGPSFLGPELGVSLRQRRPLQGSDLAMGTVFRFSMMPWFSVSEPATGPGFSWMLSWGFGFGVGEGQNAIARAAAH